MTQQYKYTPKDFKSDQEVRWCPGCGDYGILNSVQKALASLPYPKENYAVISGIGCSSRFPYYMNTYGFHSIHGRAAAIASGVKTANPELKVIQISGDGDALAIGGNHFIHTIRRNIDITMIVFNNEIYGLTKGQYSPTSKLGKQTKTSPEGTIEKPFRVAELALGARARFFARSLDINIKLSSSIITEAIEHKSTAVIEILQNCVIFNDKTHRAFYDKENKLNNFIILEDGKRMIFGKNHDRGLRLDDNGFIEVVEIGKNGITEEDILIHDVANPNPMIHWQLADMAYPEYPVALGIIRKVEDKTYSEELEKLINAKKEKSSFKSVEDVLTSGETWEVE
ncbi:2-oxoglutarate ferredoxin oxidoreductase subunit beta [Balneicella halophila]|uniref:2-oxoglutarate ferredoxin oxidoreductase subunit beta n=1 Tax=Balneicella halophila TaxID=1537566 RepID=A0A7L4UN72_BALHA|nr:2-oxoacid:ferredoxin oxidoreductase subunit beta [Balneicella halophila]PVX49989.1 2-oxoglutarate ferredoxin oxidoreductase subunit beta [Balneicella halophila]